MRVPVHYGEALAIATSNETNVQDVFAFNLPDQTLSGRTIVLQSELPAVNSNLVINGTIQPGTAFDISHVKVKIQFAPDKTDQHVVYS